MKKLLFLSIFAGFISFGAAAQTKPGNSAYGHSHKQAKKVKKPHQVSHHNDGHIKEINVRHKTAIRTIKDNDALTNQQQKDMIKQANTTHKTEMKNHAITHKRAKK